jgi:hypothetical protein
MADSERRRRELPGMTESDVLSIYSTSTLNSLVKSFPINRTR